MCPWARLKFRAGNSLSRQMPDTPTRSEVVPIRNVRAGHRPIRPNRLRLKPGSMNWSVSPCYSPTPRTRQRTSVRSLLSLQPRPQPKRCRCFAACSQAVWTLLIIDELGYVPLSTTSAELLFEVFSQRYERGSTIVTSNLPFEEWTSVFGAERLTGAQTLMEARRSIAN